MFPAPSHRFDTITADDLRTGGFRKWEVGEDELGAWIAEADFGTAPAVTLALAEAISGPGLAYLTRETRRELRQALAGFIERHFDWGINPADVWFAPDVLAILELAIDELTDPGTPVIVPTPAYMPFLPLPLAHGREVIQVPMINDDGFYRYDLEALDAAFASGAQLLVLCNPHNPVGRVLSRSELLEISDVVARHKGRVFADEIHAPLVYGEHRHIPYASISPVAAQQAITAISASKAFNLPGLKCAQMIITNDADRARWPKVSRWIDSQASTLGAYAAIAAYRDSDMWLEDVRKYLEGNAHGLTELLATHLPGARYRTLEGTFLAWIDLREHTFLDAVSAEQADHQEQAQPQHDLSKTPVRQASVNLAHFLRRQAHVVVTDGSECGQPGFIRINLATPRPILEEIITRIAEAFARFSVPTPDPAGSTQAGNAGDD